MTPYYDADGITIYHGDCADVLPLVDPDTVDLLLTDPPYGINLNTDYDGRGRGLASPNSTHVARTKRKAKANTFPPVAGDDEPFDPSPLLEFRRVVLWGANNYARHLPDSPSWIVWNRQSGGSATADAELAFTNLGGTVRMFTYLWNGCARAGEKETHGLHPTQKPTALMRWIVDRWTEPGDLVLDPYMGSGPVAQACRDLGRRYIGCELVEEYCKVAVDRLAQGVLDFGGVA